MKIQDLLFLALKDLGGRKIRSWLTILGIVIGIAAVVGLVGATQSIQEEINKQLGKLEADKITIMPGKNSFSSIFMGVGGYSSNLLTQDDLNAIKKLPIISDATGIVSKTMNVESKGEKMQFSVKGIEPSKWEDFFSIDIALGRKMGENEGKVAIIGNNIAYKYFKNDLKPKSRIMINNVEFVVVGILEPAGGFMSTEDSTIYIPESEAREIMDFEEGKYTSIYAKRKSGEEMSLVADLIEKALLKTRDVSEKDFTIITPDFVQDIVNNIMGLMTVLLGAISAISLIVGGIGIANTMYMTVMEKTREIGIMKAIGAKNKDVMRIFLLEAGIIGFVGGVIGICLGYVLGSGFLFARGIMAEQSSTQLHFSNNVESIYFVSFVLTPEIVVFSLAFSFLIGIVSGILPAKKAAKMNVISALRYE